MEKTNCYICSRCFGTGKLLKVNGKRPTCMLCKGTGMMIKANKYLDVVSVIPEKRNNKVGFLLVVFRQGIRYKKFNKQLGIYHHKPIAKKWIDFSVALDSTKLEKVKNELQKKCNNYKGS